MPGVRRYKPSVPRAKAVSPAPASQAGTIPSTRAVPMAISAVEQQAGELLGVELAQERIGSRRKAMELACGASSAARLDSPASRK
jgi:hypothetical protein